MKRSYEEYVSLEKDAPSKIAQDEASAPSVAWTNLTDPGVIPALVGIVNALSGNVITLPMKKDSVSDYYYYYY
jgi:hypothetical protein